MGTVPVLKPAEVERLLRRLGFGLVRQRDISPALLRQVSKDIGLAIEDLPAQRQP